MSLPEDGHSHFQQFFPRRALLLSLFLTTLLIVRTWLEERTLHTELPGYSDYAQQTRYRLIPGIW